jgi:DNA-directed RNA polymerase specialized sigma24 family protein
VEILARYVDKEEKIWIELIYIAHVLERICQVASIIGKYVGAKKHVRGKIMTTPYLPGPSAYDDDSDSDELLERLDPYFVSLVRMKVPRNVIRPEMLADEIEELIQKVRIKLWLTLRRKRINNPKAYVKCIVFTEAIDMVRQYRSLLSLPLDEYGELDQGNLIFAPSEGTQDPGCEVEQAEELDGVMQNFFEAIIQLPPRQQYAVICSLKDQIDDVIPIIEALRDQLINVEAINWPEEKHESQSLRASLSIARKKLQSIRRRGC